jgi:hypothetical protein
MLTFLLWCLLLLLAALIMLPARILRGPRAI